MISPYIERPVSYGSRFVLNIRSKQAWLFLFRPVLSCRARLQEAHSFSQHCSCLIPANRGGQGGAAIELNEQSEGWRCEALRDWN